MSCLLGIAKPLPYQDYASQRHYRRAVDTTNELAQKVCVDLDSKLSQDFVCKSSSVVTLEPCPVLWLCTCMDRRVEISLVMIGMMAF